MNICQLLSVGLPLLLRGFKLVVGSIERRREREMLTWPGYETKRRWQFKKFGDDALLLSDRCYVKNCRMCKKDPDRLGAWRIPARTVKLYSSTINFKAGCNLYRAKLLKSIVKAQKSKVLPQYGKTLPPISVLGNEQQFGDIEIRVDSEVKLLLNGNGKRGTVRDFMKKWTCRVRVGRNMKTVGRGLHETI